MAGCDRCQRGDRRQLFDEMVRHDERVETHRLGPAGALGEGLAVDDLVCGGEEPEGSHGREFWRTARGSVGHWYRGTS